MITVENIIWIGALVYVIFMLLRMRRAMGTGGIIVPPIAMSVLLFILFMAIAFFSGWSSLHLLWLFLLSLILGTVLLIFGPVQTFLFRTLTTLAIGMDLEETIEEVEETKKVSKRQTRKGKRKKK